MAGSRSLGVLSVDLIARTLGFDQGMDAAQRKMQSTLRGMKKDADDFGASLKSTLANAAAAFGIGLSLDRFIGSIKESISWMDQMGKSAQRVGESVKDFSSLSYAAGLADVSADDLQSTLGKLIKNMAAAQQPTSEQAKVFKALGIATTDASGKLRDGINVLKDFSDRFKSFGGDQDIIAAGMVEFGKSFQTLIPLIKDGSGAISDAQQNAKDFGAVVDEDAAAAAERFNDDIKNLKTATQGWINQLVQSALPTLDAWADDAKKLARDHEDLKDKADALVDTLKVLAAMGDAVAGGFKVISGAVQTAAVGIGVFFDDWGEVQNIISHPFSEDAWKTGLRDIADNGKAAADSIKGIFAETSKGISADFDAAKKNLASIGQQAANVKKQVADATAGGASSAQRAALHGAFANPTGGAGAGAGAGTNALASLQQFVTGLTDSSLFVQGDKALTTYVQDMAKLEDEFDKATAKGADAGAATSAYWTGAAANVAKYDEALKASDAAVEEFKASLDDQYEAQKQVIQVQLATMTMGDQAAANYKQLADATAEATKAIADFQRQYRLHPDSMSPQAYQEELAALKVQKAAVLDLYRTTQDQMTTLDGDFGAGLQKGMADFIESTNNLFNQGQQFIQNFTSGFADAFVEWGTGAESAKKAFGDFIDSMYADALRFLANQAIKDLFNALGGLGSNGGSQNVFSSGVFGSNGNGLDSGSGSSGSWLSGILGALFGGGHAAGGAASPGMFYRVNENSPELLSVGGSDYLMMGARGGYVHPTQGQGQGVTQYFNVAVAPTSTRQTADQVALAVARKQRVAQARTS